MKTKEELLAYNLSKLGKKGETIGILDRDSEMYIKYSADDPLLTKEMIIKSHEYCSERLRDLSLALNAGGKLSNNPQAQPEPISNSVFLKSHQGDQKNDRL